MLLQLSDKAPFRLDLPDWAAVHAMAFIGLLDDRLNLRARYKALAGLAVAMMLALHVATTTGGGGGTVPFLGLSIPNHPMFLFPLLMLWFWAVPQAYNLIDGINGLSLGLAALLLGVLGWNLGSQSPLFWGGLVAVLALNFPKARHFSGDCGALMLGTLFAILGVQAFGLKNPDLLLWVFAYPIVDVSLVVGIRRWKGLPLGEADRSHLHHWMMDRIGGRSWLATPALLVLAALPMLRATAIPGHVEASLLGLVALVLLALKAFKDRVGKHAQEATALTQVRREIPFMVSGAIREPSGSHPRL
jgi:UDP-GlcNAc:undecaprenyl-phosphate GlcNAc-1-phosphate transferase